MFLSSEVSPQDSVLRASMERIRILVDDTFAVPNVSMFLQGLICLRPNTTLPQAHLHRVASSSELDFLIRLTLAGLAINFSRGVLTVFQITRFNNRRFASESTDPTVRMSFAVYFDLSRESK